MGFKDPHFEIRHFVPELVMTVRNIVLCSYSLGLISLRRRMIGLPEVGTPW